MNAKAKIQAQLSAYLDGELDEAQLRQVEEALENDGNLRAELADLSAARKLLRDMPAEKPSADLVSRVLAEAERTQLVGGQAAESTPSPLRWIRYAASAAVLLVAATVGLVIAVTLCSPEIYKDDLSRHSAPDIRNDEKTVAAADGRRNGMGRDSDGDELTKLSTRGLLRQDKPEAVEGMVRGGGGSGGAEPGGHGFDGKLGTLGDNGRSRASGFGRSSVSDKKYGGDAATNAGSLTLTNGGEGRVSGVNTYTGGTTIGNGTLAKGGDGAVSLSGGNTHSDGITVGGGTLTKNGAGTLAPGGAVNVMEGNGDVSGGVVSMGVAGRGGDHWKGAWAKGLGETADAASGPFDNVKNMSRVLAGNTTNNTIIYTDRLDLTQRQVETVLNANGVAPIVTQQSGYSSAMNTTGRQASQARGGNFYVANTLSPAQVQYEAYVTPEQMAKVQKDLDILRARQNVSQDVPALAYAGTAAKDGGWGYTNGPADRYGHFVGKESENTSGLAFAKGDAGSTFGRRVAPADMPVAQKVVPVAPKGEPVPVMPGAAPLLPPADPAVASVERAAKSAPPPALVPPAAETALPAPVVVAEGPKTGEKAGQKARQDDRALAEREVQLGGAIHNIEAKPAKAPDKDETQLAEAFDNNKTKRAKLSESRPALAAAYDGPSADDLLRDSEPRREIAQTSPAGPVGKASVEAGGNRLRALVAAGPDAAERPSAPAPSVAAKPAETPAPNLVAKPGNLRDFDDQVSTRPAERMPGQVAGPVGGQYAAGTPNPPTAPPARTQTPATTWQQQRAVQAPPAPASAPAPAAIRVLDMVGQQEQVVQVSVVRQPPLTQSGGSLDLRLAPSGQAGGINQAENLATANVLKLVITLNYRQAGEAEVNPGMDRAARFSADAASQAAPAHETPAANRAAQESAKQEGPTRSK
jgi:hypothetical protein